MERRNISGQLRERVMEIPAGVQLFARGVGCQNCFYWRAEEIPSSGYPSRSLSRVMVRGGVARYSLRAGCVWVWKVHSCLGEQSAAEVGFETAFAGGRRRSAPTCPRGEGTRHPTSCSADPRPSLPLVNKNAFSFFERKRCKVTRGNVSRPDARPNLYEKIEG